MGRRVLHSHYLTEFVNFILYNQDMKIPHAVLEDYSKAFNRICHNRIITILSRMGVPGWLLKVVMGYLTERELIVNYKANNRITNGCLLEVPKVHY